MENKKIYVTSPSMPTYEEYANEIKSLWDSKFLTNMGVNYQEFEKQITKYLGVGNASLFVNGHLALELLLQAMNLTGEVITTPYTFASTTHAIVRNNLEPVFCDIDRETCTIDVSKIEELITDRTTAIVPVHTYGNICNVEEIEQLAKSYDLKVIYDAAHAFGVTHKGVGVGNFGDASIFSFHATKAFNTIEGGAVTTNSKNLCERLYELKNFGFMNETEVTWVGSNAKMNEFQAIMGICNLRHFEENVQKRKVLVEHYKNRLKNIEGIVLKCSFNKEETTSNYTYFPIAVYEKEFGCTRNVIKEKLNQHQIYPRRYFYPLTSAFKCYQGRFDLNHTPVALEISKRILMLPLYSELEICDVDRICDLILECKG